MSGIPWVIGSLLRIVVKLFSPFIAFLLHSVHNVFCPIPNKFILLIRLYVIDFLQVAFCDIMSSAGLERLTWYTMMMCHYRPHAKDGEDAVFSLFVSSHPVGGVPQPGPSPRQEGTPFQSQGWVPPFSPNKGVPLSSPDWGGTPIQSQGGIPPSSPDRGGTPIQSQWGIMEYPPPPQQDRMGVPPPPGHTVTHRVLATRRAVCLLRSRRRTFLFHLE